MPVSPCPFVKFHVHDDNGNPATGWRLHSYVSGTDTPIPLYKDASGLIEHPNPITLDMRGEPDGDGIFLSDGQAYKLVLKRPDGSTAWSQPYVMGSGASSGGGTLPLMPARTLLGNASGATAEATAIPLETTLGAGASSVPSSKAVSDALAGSLAGVVHTSGEQAIDGNLAVSGAVSAASVSIGGQDADARFVRVDGHAGASLVGRSGSGSGAVADVPISAVIAEDTEAGSIPTVGAVREYQSGASAGMVKTTFSDEAGYLGGKILGDGSTTTVSLVDGKVVVSLDPALMESMGASKGMSMVDSDDSLGYLESKFEAGEGVSLEVTENNKVKISNAAPDTMMTKVHSASSIPGFLSGLLQGGTGVNIAMSPDMEKLVLTATGSAVGGFYWKGTWSSEGTYNVNNAVWYFDHTGEVPVSRLYIATTQNQGINPLDDAGIGTGTCWSCMMAVDYMGDQFVMLDAEDTQAGYLAEKLKAGNYVSLTRTATASGAYYVVDTLAPYQVKIGTETKGYGNLGGTIEIEAVGGSASWSGSKILLTSLALGETSATAYRGDRGKTAYDHSQATGNPHGTTASQIANAPAGSIAATNVQAAINELDSEKAPTSHNHVIANVDGLQTALDGKKSGISGYIGNGGSDTNKWWSGPSINVRNTSSYTDSSLMLIRVYTVNGDSAYDMYSAKVMFNMKNQYGKVTSNVVLMDCDLNAYGKVYYRFDSDSFYTYLTLEFYMPSRTDLHYELDAAHGNYNLNTGDTPTSLPSYSSALKRSYGTLNHQWIEHSPNNSMIKRLSDSDKVGIDFEPNCYGSGTSYIGSRNLSTGAFLPLTFEASTVTVSAKGGLWLTPSAVPDTNADSNIVPSTAWVRAVAVPTVYAPTSSTSYTLPANAPIGKQVFVSCMMSSGGATVYPPSGEYVTMRYDGGSPTQSKLVPQYAALWFTKTSSTLWVGI